MTERSERDEGDGRRGRAGRRRGAVRVASLALVVAAHVVGAAPAGAADGEAPAPRGPVWVPTPGSPEPGPSQLGYVEGQPIPLGYHVERDVRRGFLLVGALALGIPYAIGMGLAALDNFRDHTGWFAVPVAGPLIVGLANRPSCDGPDDEFSCHSDQDFNSFLLLYLALDTAVQAAGTGFLIASLNGKELLVRDSMIPVVVTPGPVGVAGYGARLSGRF